MRKAFQATRVYAARNVIGVGICCIGAAVVGHALYRHDVNTNLNAMPARMLKAIRDDDVHRLRRLFDTEAGRLLKNAPETMAKLEDAANAKSSCYAALHVAQSGQSTAKWTDKKRLQKLGWCLDHLVKSYCDEMLRKLVAGGRFDAFLPGDTGDRFLNYLRIVNGDHVANQFAAYLKNVQTYVCVPGDVYGRLVQRETAHAVALYSDLVDRALHQFRPRADDIVGTKRIVSMRLFLARLRADQEAFGAVSLTRKYLVHMPNKW